MLDTHHAYTIILSCAAVGILYGILNYWRVHRVQLRALAADGDYTPLGKDHKNHELDKRQVDQMLLIGEYISNVTPKTFSLELKYIYREQKLS